MGERLGRQVKNGETVSRNGVYYSLPSVMASASFALFPANTPLSMSRTFCGTEPSLPPAV